MGKTPFKDLPMPEVKAAPEFLEELAAISRAHRPLDATPSTVKKKELRAGAWLGGAIAFMVVPIMILSNESGQHFGADSADPGTLSRIAEEAAEPLSDEEPTRSFDSTAPQRTACEDKNWLEFIISPTCLRETSGE